MDFRKLFAGSLCTLALACTFTSCSDDDNDGFKDGGSTVQLPNKRAFILTKEAITAIMLEFHSMHLMEMHLS